ncbi:MAG: DUF1697 domain-containing protein [Proteobacteria bacterium]|nr:DUF1697 domain-containing protein [Pseudomonadota bacterium]
MTIYVALLRAVNVGGTGNLPMDELKTICRSAGFTAIETYIASGNIVFECDAPAARIKAELEKRLQKKMGKPVGVALRTGAELSAVLKANPFPGAPPNYTVAVFLDGKPPADALDHAAGVVDEEMRLGRREIYVHYPKGQGRSKLRIPAARNGTARNMNTVAALVEKASKRKPRPR